MNQATKDAISQLLRERVALTQSNQEAPHNYVSVMECILQAELKQEIDAIESMLLDLNTFEDQFKARCAQRETDKDYAIPLSAMPESMSNQLYWEIAQLAFEPATMKDMLEIIAPSINQHVKIDVGYSPISSSRHNIQAMEANPTLALVHGLDAFKQEPKIEALTHYIVSERTLLNAQEIAQLPLMLQAKLQSLLVDKHPELAKQLYGHNSSLIALSQDILSLNNKGTTPKTAIEQLILGLTVGGEKMTGQTFAGKSSIEAVGRFSEYFNALPVGIKEQLRVLEGGSTKMGDIIDKEIATGQCVETTSTHLTRILQQNSNQPVLTSPPELSPQAVNQLKNKYGPKHSLDTKKDPLLALTFPIQLTQEIIGRIAPTTDEELMNLTLDFPPLFYDTLWQHITLKDAPKALENLTRLIKLGFFNPEQKQALAQALAKHYQRFKTQQSILSWAIETKDPIFLKEVLGSYTKEELLAAVQAEDNDGRTPLHLAFNNLESLKVILDFLPKNDMLAAVQVKNNDGQTLLHYFVNNPESLKVILDLYPENDRLAAVQVKKNDGLTLLNFVAFYPESLKVILALYPENDRLAAVQVTDNYGQTILHHTAFFPESLKVILALYPENDRLAAVQVKDNFGRTPLDHAANYPESIKIIQSFLSKEQLLFLNIKDAMNKACSDYINREDVRSQSGYQFGFFSSSGGEETTKITDFNKTMQETQSIKEIITLIDTLLTSDTSYHARSLAAHVLDNLSTLIPNTIEPDEQGHYSVDAWTTVKKSLEIIAPTVSSDDSHTLPINNRPRK